MIRKATEDDIARIIAIAHAAYGKYVPRIGREPPPMVADFAAEIAADHVVVKTGPGERTPSATSSEKRQGPDDLSLSMGCSSCVLRETLAEGSKGGRCIPDVV